MPAGWYQSQSDHQHPGLNTVSMQSIFTHTLEGNYLWFVEWVGKIGLGNNGPDMINNYSPFTTLVFLLLEKPQKCIPIKLAVNKCRGYQDIQNSGYPFPLYLCRQLHNLKIGTLQCILIKHMKRLLNILDTQDSYIVSK